MNRNTIKKDDIAENIDDNITKIRNNSNLSQYEKQQQEMAVMENHIKNSGEWVYLFARNSDGHYYIESNNNPFDAKDGGDEMAKVRIGQYPKSPLPITIMKDGSLLSVPARYGPMGWMYVKPKDIEDAIREANNVQK